MLFGIEATELLEQVSFFDHRRSDKYLVDVAKGRHGCRNDNKRHGEHADQCSVEQLQELNIEYGGSIRELLLAVTLTDGFRFRNNVVERDGEEDQ